MGYNLKICIKGPARADTSVFKLWKGKTLDLVPGLNRFGPFDQDLSIVFCKEDIMTSEMSS